MIVVDASAVIFALLSDGPARRTMTNEQLHTPYLADSEVTSALRMRVRSRSINDADATRALTVWIRLGLLRHSLRPLLMRMWELRENLSAYDAGYVALAESLDCALVTGDGRLSRAPGPRCAITVVPG